MAYDRQLAKKSENVSDWYNKVIMEAELADYGPAKGTMIFRPYGYRIWELVQAAMDAEIKARGVENAYFPLFIPESFLQKEAKHVEGFAPELAVVTIGGGEELEEKLVVRPTSETIMYDAYARWVQSWRDLPVMINQWNNVVRWEKRTYLFMRTTEFLWQEGHTAHATHEEAKETQRWAMDMYARIYREWFALPGYVGHKSDSERFAGADDTLTYESLMPGGKVLQSCTSHDLGQNFSKAFGISFASREGTEEFAWQTSWGFSTRSIGGLIMAHGDDRGLVLPPKLAPVQVVIVPVRAEEAVMKLADEVAEQLRVAGVRVKVDDREGESFGFKANKWELRGVPVRLEIGPKEAEQREVTVARRVGEGGKEVVKADGGLAERLAKVLDDMQAGLLEAAERHLRENTREAKTWAEFEQIMKEHKGFIRAPWCERAECEAAIKEATKATTRCLELDAKAVKGATCVHCDHPAKHEWLFGQSY
jgi:prolyl-tRNA synthetase